MRIAGLSHRTESVAVSPDGATLAVSDNEGAITLVDASTLRMIRQVRRPTGFPVSSLAFRDGGRELSYGAQRAHRPAAVVVQAVTTRRVTLELGALDVSAVAVSSSGALVTADAESANFFWRRWGSRWSRVALGPDGHPTNFTTDGRLFLVIGPHGNQVRDGSTGAVTRRLPGIVGGPVERLSGDGRLLAVAEPTGTVDLWNVPRGALIARLAGHTAAVESLAFDRSGSRLLSASDDGTAIVWDTTTGQRVVQVRASQQSLTDAQFAPGGATFYTTARDGTLARWNATGRRGFGHTTAIPGGVAAAAFGGRAGYLVAGTDGGRLLSFDPVSGVVRSSLDIGTAVTAVAAVPARPSSLLAVATAGHGVDLVDAATSRVVRRITPSSDVGGVAWSPDGSRLALSRPAAHDVLVVDAGTGRVVARYRTLCRVPEGLAWSHTGALLAVGCQGSFVDVVATRSGGLLHRLLISDDPVAPSLAFVSGDSLAVGARDGTVSIWDARSGVRVAGPMPATPGIAAALSADPVRGLLAVSGLDGSVTLIDATGETGPATPLPGPGLSSVVAVIDPRRQMLHAFYSIGQVTSWDINPSDWLSRACRVPGRQLTRTEWSTYLSEVPYAPACGG